jgi:glycosyltransferase involved in cell wall biosynthesis
VSALHLLLPGSLGDLTGGTLYDRRVVEGLRAQGHRVQVHELDPSFPLATPGALVAAERVLAALPDGARAVVDGLACGAMPDVAARHAERLGLVALVHHPLALETGLSAAQAAMLRASETRALAHARRVVVTSRSTARALADYAVPAARIRVVEPGTDPAPAAMGRLCEADPLQLLCVATITPRKGHLLLLEALAALTHLDWRLVCVGSLKRDPKHAATLRDRIRVLGLASRVRLLGELSPAELDDRYARSDLFVLASLFEGYGMAYAEALARGLPVLGCAAGAVADTVPAEAGLLVQPGSVSALREALSTLLTDAGLRHRLAAGAMRARRRLPDWSTAAARFAAAIADV